MFSCQSFTHSFRHVILLNIPKCSQAVHQDDNVFNEEFNQFIVQKKSVSDVFSTNSLMKSSRIVNLLEKDYFQNKLHFILK